MSKNKHTATRKNLKQADEKTKPVTWPLWLLSGIVLLTAALYSNALHNEILTFDDNEYFQNYPEILNLTWSGIKKYFTGYYVIMYQPLPVLTFAINYHFTGLDPYPMHLVNLVLHLANVVLVYHFIRTLVPGYALPLTVALLFGIHPMNTEAVTWISARSSSMYTLFYISALICYSRYILKGSRKLYYITLLFFILSLFSKAQAVTLPVVMILLDYYFDRNFRQRTLYFEKIPFFLLSILFGLITLADIDTQRNLTEGMLIAYNAIDIFFLMSYSFVFYFVKLVLPVNLCAVHVFPEKTEGWLPWEYYAAGIIFISILVLLYKFRRNKNVMLCMGLFFITIAINIQIIPSRLFIVTDRYAYFPYLGLFLFPLLWINSWREKKSFDFDKKLPLMIGIFSIIIISFSIATYQRNFIWKNDIPFMTDIIEKNPPVGYIYRAYGNRGFAFKKNGMLNEALQDFNKTIELNPDDSRSFFNRALVKINMHDQAAALVDFDKAIKMDDKQPMLYNYRGQTRLILKDTAGAEKDLYYCLQLDSTYSDAYNSLASIEFGRNNPAACERLLSKAISLNPKFSIAIKNRGLVYLKLNRNADACSDFQNASYLNDEEAKGLYQQYCR